MKNFVQLAGLGIVGYLTFKVLGVLLAPLLGLAAGILGLVVKVALVMALGWIVLRLLRGPAATRREAA